MNAAVIGVSHTGKNGANPSIDAGVEDAEMGDEVYQRIMRELLRRMEAKRNGVAA